MENPKTSRRDFCAHAISFVTVASIIEGCGGGNPNSPGGGGGGGNVTQLATVSATASGNQVTVANVSGTALANPGSSALVEAGNTRILVTRSGDSFTALTAICTHEANIINGISSGTFVCPAHGSRFTSNGAVAQGPATRSLQNFPTAFTNNVLTITT